MPVLVETLHAPSAQDYLDLANIYADAPAWLLVPYGNAEALITAGLAQGNLLVGRFNDRLLGAALLQRQPANWYLSHLCVRRLTRRRGVARRLLEVAQAQAQAAGQRLQLAAATDQAEACAFAAHLQLPLTKYP